MNIGLFCVFGSLAIRRVLALAREPWCFSSHQEQAVDQCYGKWRCKLIDLRLHAVSLFFKSMGYLLSPKNHDLVPVALLIRHSLIGYRWVVSKLIASPI